MFIPDVVRPEHAELRATLRRFFESRSPEAAVRKAIDSEPGYETELWRQMSDQLGLQGLGLPEVYGGSGYGDQETTIAFEELGRALVPPRFSRRSRWPPNCSWPSATKRPASAICPVSQAASSSRP